MVDVCFSKPEVVISQPKKWYMLTIDVDEIWSVDRFWPSEGKYINKYETESSNSDRGRHLEKSIWRHISAVADPEWHDNNGDEVKIETEKSDGLKARKFLLVVQTCKSRMQKAAFWPELNNYTGNLLTVVLTHYTHSQTDEFTALPYKWPTAFS